MSLQFCPDCKHFHRGRAVVCRPCVRQRLNAYVGESVSHETLPVPHRVPEDASAGEGI